MDIIYMIRPYIFFSLIFLSSSFAREVKLSIPLNQIQEPTFLYAPATNGGVLLTMPDGKTIRFFYRVHGKRAPVEAGIGGVDEGTSSVVYEDVSTDGGVTWQLGKKAFETGEGSHSDVASVNPHTGEVYWIYRKNRKSYLIRTTNNWSDWSNEIEIPFVTKYDSTSFIWLKDKEKTGFHRIVAATRSGAIGTVSYISDDDGLTWQGPSNLCTSPNRGDRWQDRGISGHVVELKDGRLWMLCRNAQDHLWEYFSNDRGKSWSEGQPSRFVGVFSNVRLYRISQDRLMILWLNSMPRKGVSKQANFHKTSRDVLHAAISDDDGKTWRGFREVALSKQRHSLVYTRMPTYDATIHHQKFTLTKDNKVIIFTGQDDAKLTWGSEHRQAVIFDLDWLYETSRSTEFSNEYADLNVFKLSKKPLKNTKDYSRILGATLVGHPTEPYKKVLHLGREKCDWVWNEQDGANWNFPIGKKGSLETRILLRKGFKGGAISLVDVFYPPSDNSGDEAAMYSLDIPADGRLSDLIAQKPDTWYDLKLEWTGVEDNASHSCKVYINGTLLPQALKLKNTSPNGICYSRFRSTAAEADLAGWIVESIKAKVEWIE